MIARLSWWLRCLVAALQSRAGAAPATAGDAVLADAMDRHPAGQARDQAPPVDGLAETWADVCALLDPPARPLDYVPAQHTPRGA